MRKTFFVAWLLCGCACVSAQLTLKTTKRKTPATTRATAPATQPLIALRDDAPEDVRRWLNRQPELRKQEIEALEREYDAARKHMPEYRKEAAARLKLAKGDKTRLVYPVFLAESVVGLRGFADYYPKVGDIGRFDTKHGVVSVAGQNDLLARTYHRETHFWFSGISTEGIVDRHPLPWEGPVRLIGTRQYESAAGVKTVWHFVPFRLEEYVNPTTQPSS